MNINQPTNFMYGYDYFLNSTRSNSLAAISLQNSTILDFIRAERFKNSSEKDMNSKEDFFTYINIEQISHTENPLFIYNRQSVNLTLDKEAEKNRIDSLLYNLNGTKYANPKNYWNDNVFSTFMPFVGNCKFLGNHITFKDFLMHPSCNLTASSVNKLFYLIFRIFY
jgi:hypothetical protein